MIHRDIRYSMSHSGAKRGWTLMSFSGLEMAHVSTSRGAAGSTSGERDLACSYVQDGENYLSTSGVSQQDKLALLEDFVE